MKKLFISEDVNNKIRSMLEGMGFLLLLLPKEEALSLPTASHADMLLFSDGRRLVTARSYYQKHPELFCGVDIMLTDDEFGSKYPRDIIFNAFVFEDTLFGYLEALSPKVVDIYHDRVKLRQGYAKCSTLLFGTNAITADRGIAATLREKGCKVLEITPGHISLPGYDYGFIGGASFVYEDRVIFFGNIEEHPDHERILDFIRENGYTAVYERSLPLTDHGGALTC